MQGIDNNVVGVFFRDLHHISHKFTFFYAHVSRHEKMWVMLQCSFILFFVVTTYNMKFNVNTYEILL